ncbi:MAG TPA: glutathione S-transferase N-terminal domain-containing protein [Capillimicrobium sp.]|nr:glutathione S-transferase N-terminal domain-containing protein [Capillimicrobium sp.]
MTRVVLHRCPTPTDWLCPCGRVARELRAAGIEHDTVRVPLRKAGRDEVARLSGQRHVPLLVIDGEAICDSKRIVEHLRWRAATARPGAERPQ